MSVVRVAKRDKYTIISSSTFNDKRLSFRARGVLCWLLDKPENWRIDAEAISSHGVEGRDAIRAALKELEENGYLVRNKFRNPTGQWASEHIVYERPQIVDQSGKPAPVDQRRETRPFNKELNTETISNTTDPEKDSDTAASLAAFKNQPITNNLEQAAIPKSQTAPPNSAAPPLDNPPPTNVYTLEDIYEAFCRGSGHRPEAPSEIAQWQYQCKPFLRIKAATPEAVEAAAKRQDEQWDPQYPRTPASLYKNWGKLYRKPKSKAKVTLVDHEPWMDQIRATFPVPEGHEDWYERNQAARQANLAANGGVFQPFD